MARRDVDLIIKAKDQAASVVDSITKALLEFVEAQQSLDSRADKTESTMTALGSAIGKLDKQLRGLDPGEKLAAGLEKSTNRLASLEQQFAETSGEASRLQKQLDQSQFTLDKYSGKLERNLAVQRKQKDVIARAKVDQRELTASYEKAVSAQEKLQRRQERLPGLIQKAGAAADRASRDFDKLSIKVLETEKPTKALTDRLSASEDRMARTGQRLRELREEFGNIGSKINAAGSAVVLFGGQSEKAGRELKRQQSILANMAGSYDRIKASTAAVGQRQTRLASDLNRSSAALGRLEKEIGDARTGLDRLAATSSEATADLQRLTKRGFLALVSAARDQKRLMLETGQAYDKARAQATALGRALAQTSKPTRDMVEDFTRAAAESTRLKNNLAQQRQSLQQMQQTLRQSGRSYEDLRNSQARFLTILERQADSLTRADTAARRQSASVRALASTASAAAVGSSRLADSNRRLASASERAAASTSRLSAAYRQFYGDTRRSLSLLQRIRGEVLSLVAAYGGLYGAIRALELTVDSTQQLEAATARLNVAFENDPDRLASELDFIRRSADRLGVSLGVIATEYSKFNIATKNTSLEGERARRIFLQVSEAARVNRSSTDELKGVFVALTQIVSKGAVQMEELRQQLGDRLPGALQIMADGLGVTTPELVKMTEQGEITEEALVGFADELERRFGQGLPEALEGITVALGRLQNAAFQAATGFGEAGFIDGLKRFADTLTEVLGSADFEAFSRRLSKAFEAALDFLSFLASNFQTVATLLVSLLAFKLTPIVLALGAGFVRVTGQARTLGGGFSALQARAASMGVQVTRAGYAVRFLSRSMQALIGSTGVGLAFVAVSAAITQWATEADIATDALNDHQEILDQVRNAYEAVGGSVEDWRASLEGLTEQELVNNVRRLREARDATVDLLSLSAQGNDDFATNFFGFNLRSRSVIRNVSREAKIAVDQVVQAFLDGRIAAEDFEAILSDAMVRVDDGSSAFRKYSEDVFELAERLLELEQALQESDQAITATTGSLEDGQEALDDLAGSAGEAATSFSAFNSAMQALRGEIPSLTSEMGAFETKLASIEEKFQDALAAARDLPEAIMRIAAAQEALEARDLAVGGAFQEFADAEFGNFTDGVEATAALLRQLEGFRATPYWDENALRAGYGSDTVTLEDGSIRAVVEGTRVSVADANRDLIRRITTEFMPRAARVAGQERFDTFTPQQQAALTSIAYNYGEIPDRIAEAVRTGTNEQIAEAIRSLGGDNNGQNRRRRNTEAALFLSTAGIEGQISQQQAEDERRAEEAERAAEEARHEAERAAEAERERSQATQDRIGQTQFEIEQQRLLNAERGREAAIEAAIREAREENPDITAAQIAQIREQTGALFDLQNAVDERAAAEARVNDLLSIQGDLTEQIRIAEEAGDTDRVGSLQSELESVNQQLIEATNNAISMWSAVGGSEADAAIARLETVIARTSAAGDTARDSALDFTSLADVLVSGLTSAFDRWAQAVANGENALSAARDAFLQFASDFLIEIGKMIIQQTILNALQGLLGGTPFGAAIGLGTVGAGHTGGLVGSSRVGSGNSSRVVHSGLFANAARYHLGGIVGLRPGEVPIIGKEGEEMLTRDDPRHMLNGGSGSGGGGAPTASEAPKVLNYFDFDSFLEAALTEGASGKAVLNFLRSNSAEVRAAMEG